MNYTLERSIRYFGMVACIPLVLHANQSPAMQDAQKLPSSHWRIPIEVKKNLKIVYQVSEDNKKNGVNKALFYAKKLLDIYNANGIPDSEIDLHLVFHSKGIYALIDAASRQRLKVKDGIQNANLAIVDELVKRGVSIELCESTMMQYGVEPKELIGGVSIVVAAYARIIDLQQLGYAYIKFE